LQENAANACGTWAALGLTLQGDALGLPHGRATLLPQASGFALTGNAQTRGCVVHLRLVSDDTGLMQRWQTRLQSSSSVETVGCSRDNTGVAPATGGQ
jgi:hypothetical protein